MALDELLQGLQAFHQGLQEVAQQNAINDAQSQVAQIKQQGLNDQKQMQAMSGVAGELTQRLAGLGMSAAAIQQVGQSLGPTPDQLMNNQLQQQHLQQQDTLTRLHYQTMKEMNAANNQTKLQIGKSKASGDMNKDITKAVTDFNGKYTKGLKEQLGVLDQGMKLVDEAQYNPAAGGTVPEKVITGITGLKRLNENEIKLAGGDPSIAGEFNRLLEKKTKGTLDQADAQNLIKTMALVRQQVLSSINDEAKGLSLQLNQAYPNMPVEQLYSRFLPKGHPHRLEGESQYFGAPVEKPPQGSGTVMAPVNANQPPALPSWARNLGE
jgi:hypothetical protein